MTNKEKRYKNIDWLIDIYKREVESCTDPFCGQALGYRMAISFAESLPEEDVVEVVRCIECEYCKFNSSAEVYKCDRRGWLETVMPNDFCSKGKRKGVSDE